jgi:hypothetical protein
MVGGTTFHRRVIQREISRVLVLNLSGEKQRCQNTDGIRLCLTPPSFLSRATRPDTPDNLGKIVLRVGVESSPTLH